jgi:hypothetical protein
MIFASQICAQTAAREGQRRILGAKPFVQFLRQKPTKQQQNRLAPDAADLVKHARFLEQPKTGIFRLLPDLGCEENPLIIRADEKCLESVPEGSFYSFRERKHTKEFLSDIRLKNNHLITHGALSQGILVNLGEAALETLSPESSGLRFLRNYAPHSSGVEVQRQFLEVARGIKDGEYDYRKAFPVNENMTFALRVIAYRGNIFRTFSGYRYNLLSGDKRIDLTVAFRIIRKDADGGITVLWKELERKDSPRIIFHNKKG